MPPFPVEPRYKSATDADAAVSSDRVLRKLQRTRCTRLSIEPVSPDTSPRQTTRVLSDKNCEGSPSSSERKQSVQRVKPQHPPATREDSPPSSPITPPGRERGRTSNVSRRRPPRMRGLSEEKSGKSKSGRLPPAVPVPPRNVAPSQTTVEQKSLSPCSPVDDPLSAQKSTRRRRKPVNVSPPLVRQRKPKVSVDVTEELELELTPSSCEKKSSVLPSSESLSWCAICAQDEMKNLVHVCELRLNQASDAMVFSFFECVPGLGQRLANRVVSARAEAGPFMSAADFDRRVTRLSFARLSSAAAACSFSVSLEITIRPMPGRAIAGCSIQVSLIPDVKPRKNQKTTAASASSLFTLSTWNAAHLSLRSRYIKDKMGHLVRFAQDAAPLVLAVQEVYGDVPNYMARVLTNGGCDGEQWGSCTPEGTAESSSSSNAESMMQAFCYRSDVIDATDLSSAIPETLLDGFLRPPAVAMFSPKCEDVGVIHERTIALVNVHLSTRYYTSEVAKLPALLEFIRDHVSALGGNADLVMCLGDFNVSGDAECFQDLQEIGFTELVRPPNNADSSMNKQYLTTPTTVGGNWYDNVLMTMFARQSLENAWCFDFGGRCAALADSSGYEYAGTRRSQRSDHFALVARYCFGHDD